MIALCGISTANALPFFVLFQNWLGFCSPTQNQHLTTFVSEFCCNDNQVRFCWRCLFLFEDQRSKELYRQQQWNKERRRRLFIFKQQSMKYNFRFGVSSLERSFCYKIYQTTWIFFCNSESFLQAFDSSIQAILLVETNLMNSFFAWFQYQR